jgi:UDP-GlcNAc3NAcA epimerase
MKLLTVVGARPQFVKAAALSRALDRIEGIEELIVHTGQHFDSNMSEVFFEEMQIPKPAFNLAINSLGHGAMTGRMLEEIEKLILSEKPNMVLVYGDTNSTIAGALAAKKLHVAVGHVEAGLRSFNMAMPEEVNRILTDRISDHLFCPTDTAINNLKKEGYDNIDCHVHRTGDVMQDAAIYYAQFVEEKSHALKDNNITDDIALVTIHRAENTDDPERLNAIVNALNHIQKKLRVVCPLHPRTRKIMDKLKLIPEFDLIDPVGYFDMIALLQRSKVVLTDSGGLQKEAFFFNSPCVTMRDQTEWVELVENGFNMIAGADSDQIIAAFNQMIDASPDFSLDLYGKGKASENIASIIASC